MNQYVLDIPFEQRALHNLFKIKWDSEHKISIYEGEQLPELLEEFQSKIFSYSWNQYHKIHKKKPKIELVEPLWKPRPHQAIASEYINNAYKNKSPGFLLADDVGLGKTISAWSFVLQNKTLKDVLIVCPVAVIAHWRNTILHMGSDNKNILIINYESLSKIFTESKKKKLSSTKSKGKQKRIAKELDAPNYDLIIWDESHKCKNTDNARSIMASKLRKNSGFDLWLSATAGQNPLELSYLSSLLTLKTGKRVLVSEDFEVWCEKVGLKVKRGAYGKWIWESNEKDTQSINNWLFKGTIPVGIRRTPVEISGWTELSRNLFPIELSQAERELYKENWKTFRLKEMGEKIKQKQSESLLIKSLRFRQKSSWIRIEETVDLIQEHLENNLQVAVSVAFRETQSKIIELLEKKKIACAQIHGSLSTNDKEKERLDFQKGNKKVIIFTVEEGISLHEGEHNDAKRVLLIHDIRWSGIQMAQIEGRCHRDGKFAPVYWLYAEDTIEFKITSMLFNKIKSMKQMMGDDTNTLKEIEKILEQN